MYTIQCGPDIEPWDFGCRHLTDADRQALLSGTVPEHLRPEFGPMTAWGLSGRFRALAADIVEFRGRSHRGLAEVLRALQDAECTALGFAGAYPVIDEEDQAAEASAADVGFADKVR